MINKKGGTMNNEKLNVILLLIGVFFLSTSAIFVKVLDVPTAVIAFYRLLFSSVIMFPVILFNKKLKHELFSLTFKQYFKICVSGLLLAAHYLFWFESLNYTSVASSTVIVTLQPVFAVVAGYIFLKERVNRFGLMGISFAILGSCYIGWQDFQHSVSALYGDSLALMAAILITMYFYIGKNSRKSISVITYSVLGYFSSSAILLVYGIVQKKSFVNYSRSTCILLVCMAVCSTTFGQMLINWVLKWMNTTSVSVAILTETIWATLLSIVILGEGITGKQIIGIAIIIAGLLVYACRDKIVSKEKIQNDKISGILKGDI